jgi:hypothetical protein
MFYWFSLQQYRRGNTEEPRGPEFESRKCNMGSAEGRATLRNVSSLPEYFGFPCHSFSPPTAPQPSFTIHGSYYSQVRGLSNNGLGSTPAKAKSWRFLGSSRNPQHWTISWAS